MRHPKPLVILLIVLIASSPCLFAEKPDTDKSRTGDLLADIPFYLEVFEMKDKIEVSIDRFYFVNLLFIQIFENFGLFSKLQDDDLEYIAEESLRGLRSRAPVNLICNNYQNANKLAFSFSIISKDKKNYLLILSNYDSKHKTVLPLDTQKEKRQDCFSSIYLITTEKLVNENHFYSKEIEREVKKTGNSNNIADFYLFDELTENDALIEDLLTKAYASPKTIEDKFRTALMFALYYMMREKYDTATSSLAMAQSILDTQIKDKKTWGPVLAKHKQELDIVRKIAAKDKQKQ